MKAYIFSNRSVTSESGVEKLLDDWGENASIYNMRFAFFDTEVKKIDVIPDLQFEDEDEENKAVQYTNLDAQQNLQGSKIFFFELYKDIKESEQNNPDKNKTLIFVHGHWVTVKKSIEFLLKMTDLYITPNASPFKRIIMYSWPSIAGKFLPTTLLGALNHAKTSDRCAACGTVLFRFYSKLWRFADQYIHNADKTFYDTFKNNFSLMTQSMGNLILSSFVEKACRYKQAQLMQFNDLFMMAADIKYDFFEKNNPLQNIERIAKRTHVYYKNDSTLDKSKFWFTLTNRMGEVGPKNKNIKPEIVIPVNANTINDITVSEQGDEHRYFLTSATIVKDILAVANANDLNTIAGRTQSTNDSGFVIT